jgi:hypothetical protein
MAAQLLVKDQSVVAMPQKPDESRPALAYQAARMHADTL